MSGQKIEETLEDLHEFHDATTGMWTSDWVLQVCLVLSVLAERVGREGCVCFCVCVCVCVRARARWKGAGYVV
jgi:hypothetical protein